MEERDPITFGRDIGYKTNRILSAREITAIYEKGDSGRWVPEWITDNDGNTVGYTMKSIDAGNE